MQLEVMARNAGSVKALQFMILNETHHLILFRQAFLFSADIVKKKKFPLEYASSISVIDRNTTFANWLESCVNYLHFAYRSEYGLLRSAAFVIATISWVMSLTINLNILMRFDGYYIFLIYLAWKFYKIALLHSDNGD
jgi:hypothetical protein